MKLVAISGLMRHVMSCSTCWIPAFGLFESKSRGLRNVVEWWQRLWCWNDCILSTLQEDDNVVHGHNHQKEPYEKLQQPQPCFAISFLKRSKDYEIDSTSKMCAWFDDCFWWSLDGRVKKKHDKRTDCTLLPLNNWPHALWQGKQFRLPRLKWLYWLHSCSTGCKE